MCPHTGCDLARRMMNGSLRKIYKYVRYNNASNVSTFGGDPVSQ